MDERCFIIGNGPSINKMDLTKLKDEITFGCNTIYNNYDKMGFNVNYYFSIDSIIALLIREKSLKYISNPDVMSGFFLSEHSKYIFGSKVRYINRLRYYTVGMSMIWKAIELGYDKIYTIGMDLDWKYPPREDMIHIKNADNLNVDTDTKKMLTTCQVNWESVCIYKDDTDDSHYSNVYSERKIPIHHIYASDAIAEYKKNISKIPSDDRCKIFNAGIEGNFDFVERVDYDSLF